MALKVFHDETMSEEITPGNPDTVKGTVVQGHNFSHIRPIYVGTLNQSRTFENILIKQNPTKENVYIDYALTEAGLPVTPGDQPELVLSDGDYHTALEVWRRVTIVEVEETQVRALYHELSFHEFLI